jgi:hypothetical protein
MRFSHRLFLALILHSAFVNNIFAQDINTESKKYVPRGVFFDEDKEAALSREEIDNISQVIAMPVNNFKLTEADNFCVLQEPKKIEHFKRLISKLYSVKIKQKNKQEYEYNMLYLIFYNDNSIKKLFISPERVNGTAFFYNGYDYWATSDPEPQFIYDLVCNR